MLNQLSHKSYNIQCIDMYKDITKLSTFNESIKEGVNYIKNNLSELCKFLEDNPSTVKNVLGYMQQMVSYMQEESSCCNILSSGISLSISPIENNTKEDEAINNYAIEQLNNNLSGFNNESVSIEKINFNDIIPIIALIITILGFIFNVYQYKTNKTLEMQKTQIQLQRKQINSQKFQSNVMTSINNKLETIINNKYSK